MTAAYEFVCYTDSREKWLEARRTGIGSSDAPVLMTGRHFGRTPLDVFCEKVGTAPATRESEQMEWGQAMEPVLLGRWMHVTGRRAFLFGQMIRSTRWPFMLSTPDGWECAGSDGVLEIKTSGQPWDDGVPRGVWIQVQHQLAVTGFEKGAVACLAGGFGGLRFMHAEIERDEEFIADLVLACSIFWNRVIDVEPPGAGPHDSAALSRLYPEPEEDAPALQLGEEWLAKDEALQLLEGARKNSVSEIDGIKNELKQAMGKAGATVAILPDGTQYRWSKGKRRRLTRRERPDR